MSRSSISSSTDATVDSVSSYLSPDLVEMGYRLVMAIAAGSLVGLERYHRGHPAGMRTFALVSLTAALLTVPLGSGPYAHLMGTFDNGGSRVVQGILAGIGFIGAGVIVREGLSVRGLTSAACMWAVSAIGILIGTGETLLGFAGAVFVLTILVFFRWLDQFIPRRSYANVHAKFSKESVPDEKALRERLESYGFVVLSLAFKGVKSGALVIHASVWAPGTAAADARANLALDFRGDPKVVDFSVEPVSSE
ncbi:MAG: MgtC/SapB family protein [Burkholderiales bacterium]